MNRRGFFGMLAAVAALPFAKRKRPQPTGADVEKLIRLTLSDLGPPAFCDIAWSTGDIEKLTGK